MGDDAVGGYIELNNTLKIPRLGLGVWQIPDGTPTERAVTWALEAGYRHIDTAKLYKNEASVGKAVRQSPVAREDIWVTTKLWPTDGLWAGRAFEASLGRLGLDYVDLYLVHWPPPGLMKRTWKAMESILAGGKVRAIGVSNYSIAQLSETLEAASVPPCVNQIKCSPFNYDRAMGDFCRQHGVVIEAYSPLTRGQQLGDARLSAMAKRYGKSTAQLLIRWALQKDMVVLPKSANEQRIKENAEACNFTISDEDVAELDTFAR